MKLIKNFKKYINTSGRTTKLQTYVTHYQFSLVDSIISGVYE